MQTDNQTPHPNKDFNIGQEYDQKVFTDSILDSYYDIDATITDPQRLVEDIKTLQEQLNSKIALLRKQAQIKIPTFDSKWFARTLKHNFPEVMSLATENYMGKDLYTLETQKAPMELVHKGENCFYRTPNVFSYKLSFAPGYAWFENKTNWGSSFIEDLQYTPGTHPHASEDNTRKFTRICTGRDNPFFQQLTQINKESDEQIKSMLRLALRWMRTYNINDAYHQQPVKHSCPTIKSPAGIVEALDEDPDFNLPHFQITMLDTLYIIHDVLTQPWEETTPTKALLRIEAFSHMVHDLEITNPSLPNTHQPLIGLVLSLGRLARYTADHTDNTTLERMQTSNEDAYWDTYRAIRTNPNNRHFNTYGAWVELYHTVYAWVMLLGAMDFSVAPANVGTVKHILVHDLLYPTRAGGKDYALDAYITALCARAITPEEIPIARWFKPVTDTLPNLPKVMRLMAGHTPSNPGNGTVGHYILSKNTNTTN